MEPIADDFEVVHVTKPCALLDRDLRERVYWRRDGVPLAGGYYVVSWPAGTTARIFNEDTAFHGPFGKREDAVAAMRALQARALRVRQWPPAPVEGSALG